MKTTLAFLSLFFVLSVFPADWPQFLGPNRDGTISDETFVQAWLKDGIKEHWRIPIGSGFSGLTVQKNQVFTMDSNGKDEFLIALTVNTRSPSTEGVTRGPRPPYTSSGEDALYEYFAKDE